ncbi:MAG: hypothetical protein GX951_00250 [Mollicutes bacterium]|nr:hypothetical protein [Mollicutes bacterium]
MGSISYVYQPECWKIVKKGISIYDGKPIYTMVIGGGIDYLPYEFVENISKENYDRILSREYKIKTFAYSKIKILLFNKEGNLIPLVNGKKGYYENLTEEQKEFISNYQKIFVRSKSY